MERSFIKSKFVGLKVFKKIRIKSYNEMRKESRRREAGSIESSRKKLLEVRIITGCAWIPLHSDYAFNGSPPPPPPPSTG